jgi:hypothetical protein
MSETTYSANCYIVFACSGDYDEGTQRALVVYEDKAHADAYVAEIDRWMTKTRERYEKNRARGDADDSPELETWDRMFKANQRLLKSNPFDPECDDIGTRYVVSGPVPLRSRAAIERPSPGERKE